MKKIIIFSFVLISFLLTNIATADIIAPSFGDPGYFIMELLPNILPIILFLLIVAVLSFLVISIMRKVKKIIKKRRDNKNL